MFVFFSFLSNDFDEAIEVYKNVIQILELDDKTKFTQSNADVHVKISTILQGQGKLSNALEYLIQARDIYHKCVNENGGKVSTNDEVLPLKLIEVITGIANIYVDEREIGKASKTYQVRSFHGKIYLLLYVKIYLIKKI